MRVTILYFAAVRDLAGTAEREVVLPDAVRTIGQLAGYLQTESPTLSGKLSAVRWARNEVFVDESEQIGDGDVIAVIPPVAGG